MEVTAEFLEGKIIYYNHPQFGRVPVRSGDGSIMKLEENFFHATKNEYSVGDVFQAHWVIEGKSYGRWRVLKIRGI